MIQMGFAMVFSFFGKWENNEKFWGFESARGRWRSASPNHYTSEKRPLEIGSFGKLGT